MHTGGAFVRKMLRRATLCSIAIGLGTYFWFAIPYWLNAPVIEKRYVSDFNHEVAKIPQDQRAWPLLRKSRILDAIPDEATFPKGAPTSTCWDDPQLDASRKFLAERKEPVELIRMAAGSRRLGAFLSTEQDFVLGPKYPVEERLAAVPAVDLDADPWMLTLLYPYMGTVRASARMMALDMSVAGAEGDGARCISDFKTMLELARLVADPPVLIGQLVGVAVEALAIKRLQVVSATYPALFSMDEWAEIDRVLSTGSNFAKGVDFEWENRQLDDWAQRIFAPGPDGRITARGYEFLNAAASRPVSPFEAYVIGPASASGFGTRGQYNAFRDEMFKLAETESKRAPQDRDEAWIAELERQANRQDAPRSFRVLAIMAPAVNKSIFAFAKLALEWDVMRAITRIERYRLSHGKYPASELEMRSAIDGELPLDIFSGRPLRCRFDAGGVMIYSVGANRVDDGGIPAKQEDASQKWVSAADAKGAASGDWILWPPTTVEWADGSDHPLEVRTTK